MKYGQLTPEESAFITRIKLWKYTDKHTINRLYQIVARLTDKLDAPIDLVITCPQCHFNHVDKPEPEKGWENPPHKTHLCHFCGHKWKPAGVYTNGVRELKS